MPHAALEHEAVLGARLDESASNVLAQPASVVVEAGLESGVVASGLFVIVVLPDGAQVLRDEARGDEQGAAHGRRDDRCPTSLATA